MAAATSTLPPGLSTLRSISLRISSAKPLQLPHIVASQVHSLKDCAPILSHPWSSQSSGASGEAALVVHRLHTQIAALLQGRLEEERWAATVLIKAVVEVGGHETLSKGKHWVSGLLANLRKANSPSTKALCVMTLTRIFMLTWPFPSLVREITTPALPQFIKTCLQYLDMGASADKLARTILECFAKLIPHHPTIFRSHIKEINGVLVSIFGALDDPHSNAAEAAPYLQSETRIAAARLRPLLLTCHPKQGTSLDYGSSVSIFVTNCHGHADVVLAAVEEVFDSDSKDAAARKTESTKAMFGRTQTPQNRVDSMYASAHRLELSLENLIIFILNDSGAVVNFPVKDIHGLVLRLLGVVASQRNQLPRFMAGTSRDERDACVDILPKLHVAVLQLVQGLFRRFDEAASNLGLGLMQQIQWVFEAENAHLDVRTACYAVLTTILSDLGLALGKAEVEHLGGILSRCCEDVSPTKQQSETITLANSLTNGSKQQSSATSDHHTTHARATSIDGLQQTASALLEVVLANIPRSLVSDTSRSQIDRTGILAGESKLLVASVLNPSKRKDGRVAPSLLPFLARTGSTEPIVEALLRPRAPVLQSGSLQDDGQLYSAAREQSQIVNSWALPPADNAGVSVEPPAASADVLLRAAEIDDQENAVQQTEVPPVFDEEARSAKAGLKRSLDAEVDRDDGQVGDSEHKRVRGVVADRVNTTAPGIPLMEDAVEDRGGITASISNAAPSTVNISAAVGQAEDSDDDDFVIPDLKMDDSDED